MGLELTSPEQMEMSAETMEMIADAEEMGRQVHELRPLTQEALGILKTRLLAEQVYNSNAIEGNTLTLRETTEILQTGMIYREKRRDAQEVLNLRDAIHRIEELISVPGSAHDLEKLLSVHRFVLNDIQNDAAGCYRTADVMLRGAKFQPPAASDVERLMNEFSSFVSKTQLRALLKATWTHWALARIHPFLDGNGRMARLWQDLVLFQGNLTAAIIRRGNTGYYQALQSADEGDFNPLAQLIVQSCTATMQQYLNAQREVDELKGWASELIGEVAKADAGQLRLEYVRWSNAMEQLRDAFERCATQVTSASGGLVDLQLQTLPLLDEASWASLRSGTLGPKTGFFSLTGFKGDKFVRYYFFFGRHFSDEVLDQSLPKQLPLVNLLIGEQSTKGGQSVRLMKDESQFVTLREVIVIDGRPIRKVYRPNSEDVVYDQKSDALVIARDFVTEMVRNGLT